MRGRQIDQLIEVTFNFVDRTITSFIFWILSVKCDFVTVVSTYRASHSFLNRILQTHFYYLLCLSFASFNLRFYEN